MTVSAFLFVALVVFCLYQIAVIIWNRRAIKHYRAIRYRAETQQAFGLARHKLFKLVSEGRLPAESISFLMFYTLATTIMRHPDRYPEIAKVIRESFLRSESGNKASEVIQRISDERHEWPKEMKGIVSQMDKAMTMLMLYHSPVLRSMYALIVRNAPAKRSPENKTILQAKHELRELAA